MKTAFALADYCPSHRQTRSSGALSALTAVCVAIFVLIPHVAHANESDTTLLATGKKLVADTKCEACHAKKIGGDGTGMYTRKNRHVSTKRKLASQVALCNNELSLGLFPEDEAAITAFLNASYYKFTDEPPR